MKLKFYKYYYLNHNINNMDKFNPHDFPINYFTEHADANINQKENTKQFIKNTLGQNENEMSEVATSFFSVENMKLINKKLILRVFEYTDNTVKIPFQSNEDLLVIMRYIYGEYSENLKKDISKQVYKLNCKVIKEVLPTIISNIEGQLKYLNEIKKDETSSREINQLPVSTKMTKGTMELPSMSDVYFK